MGGLNWEKAAKNAKADKRATGLDILRNPADEMSKITRLQQARQKKNRPTPRAKLEAVDVAPELAGQAVGEQYKRARLIDKALTFEERKGAALKRHAEKTGKTLPEPNKPQSKKAQHKADQAEKKQRRAAKAERSKLPGLNGAILCRQSRPKRRSISSKRKLKPHGRTLVRLMIFHRGKGEERLCASEVLASKEVYGDCKREPRDASGCGS